MSLLGVLRSEVDGAEPAPGVTRRLIAEFRRREPRHETRRAGRQG
ncbi:MAG TPA: hypothetical protein VGP26_25915 [Actinophytocola sp.]|jgi:hypothetical protein|nr:hypothetical protein [Actinophytocola sp.]